MKTGERIWANWGKLSQLEIRRPVKKLLQLSRQRIPSSWTVAVVYVERSGSIQKHLEEMFRYQRQWAGHSEEQEGMDLGNRQCISQKKELFLFFLKERGKALVQIQVSKNAVTENWRNVVGFYFLSEVERSSAENEGQMRCNVHQKGQEQEYNCPSTYWLLNTCVAYFMVIRK